MTFTRNFFNLSADTQSVSQEEERSIYFLNYFSMVHIISTNPSTGTEIGSVAVTPKAELAKIVQTSREAQKSWGKMSV